MAIDEYQQITDRLTKEAAGHLARIEQTIESSSVISPRLLQVIGALWAHHGRDFAGLANQAMIRGEPEETQVDLTDEGLVFGFSVYPWPFDQIRKHFAMISSASGAGYLGKLAQISNDRNNWSLDVLAHWVLSVGTHGSWHALAIATLPPRSKAVVLHVQPAELLTNEEQTLMAQNRKAAEIESDRAARREEVRARLCAAIERDDVNQVREVVDSADFPAEEVVNLADGYQVTPLQWACFGGAHANSAAYLLDQAANVHHVNVLGETALHRASKGTNAELVRLLLNAGARIDAPDINNATPLLHAMLGSMDCDIIKTLIGAGPT